MTQHNSTQSQVANRSLNQTSENPYEKYSEEWYVWEEKRKNGENIQACEWQEARNEAFYQSLGVQETKFTARQIIAKIASVFADMPISATAVEQKLRLLEVFQEVSGSIYRRDFDDLVKAVRQDWRQVGYKLELKALLQESDPILRNQKMLSLAAYYSTSINLIKEDLRSMQTACNTPAVKPKSVDGFFDETSEAIDWLIPELLPKGETICLIGAPKDGKTLLAIDAAYCLATNEDKFLGHSFTDRKKVLLISCDESKGSTKAKLIKRGFRRTDKDYLHIMTSWDISQMSVLETELEDFRPDLVVIDSLKRITINSELNENSAEFANAIYQLKELLGRYGSAGILIHHTSKSKENTGVFRARGSSAISGAVWGVWQVDRCLTPDPNDKSRMRHDPKSPARILSSYSRDAEGVSLSIELNPENNSWEYKGEAGIDEAQSAEQKTLRDRILAVLLKNQHKQLSGKDIIELMQAEEQRGSVYSELSRMVSKRLVSCQPASDDKRFNVYSLLTNCDTPPLPLHNLANADYVPETITTQALEDSQQVVNNLVSIDQQENEVNCSDSVIAILSDSQKAITETEGGGEPSEPPFDDHTSSTPITKDDIVKVTDDKRFESRRYRVVSIGFGGMANLESLQNPGSRVKKSVSSLKRVQ